MSIHKLKEMFSEMVVKKNANLIPAYYHPEFLLYSNEKIMDYQEFLTSHQKYYATAIEYRVEFDENSWVEDKNKVAVRMWIITHKPNEPVKKIDVVLIAQFKEEKIYRLWETTHPDWSKIPAFMEAKA